VLSEVAADLEQFAEGMAAQLPTGFVCNYPGESSIGDVKFSTWDICHSHAGTDTICTSTLNRGDTVETMAAHGPTCG
jgi:hypothetical protein